MRLGEVKLKKKKIRHNANSVSQGEDEGGGEGETISQAGGIPSISIEGRKWKIIPLPV